jgi:hypothetical protein
MDQPAPLTATIFVSIGDHELPIELVTFEVPLRTRSGEGTDHTDRVDVDVNRTELRGHLTRSVRVLADRIEAASVAPDLVTPGEEPDTEPPATLTPAEVRRNAKEAARAARKASKHPVFRPDPTDSPENPATSEGTDQSQGELSSLPGYLEGGRTCACADRGYGIGDVVTATEISIGSASHLDAKGKDAGAVAALLTLAHKIDNADDVLDMILDQIASDPDSKIRPPAADNVSLPTYLKYSESLGLTPGGRGELTSTAKPAPAGPTAVTSFRNFGSRAG